MIYNVAWPRHDLTPPPTAAIRRGDWKYIKRTTHLSGHGEDARNLLFHLASDPEEKHNLYAQEVLVVAELEARLDEVIAGLSDQFYPEPSNAVDPALHGGAEGEQQRRDI